MNCLRVLGCHKLSFNCIKNVDKWPNRTVIRSLLSQGYSCEQEWQSRLDNELLSKISPDSFFNELNQRYQKKLKVSAVDVDIFANCVTRSEQLEELQHLVYRLRRTKETVNTLDSTHHSFCRIFIKFGETHRLLHILSDRIGFGIFADQFCNNMLLDHFTEQKDYRRAAKVVSLMMAQEDRGNKISQILALHVVHNYLNGDHKLEEWFDEEEKQRLDKESHLYPNACTDRAVLTTDENDEEVQYIRVPYLKNEWFDDHFDLRNPKHICGKTLYFFAKNFDDIMGRSCQLIGLILFEKWDKCLTLLKQFSTDNKEVVKEVLVKVENALNETSDEAIKEKISNIKQVLNQMNNDSKIVDKSVDELIENKLSEIKELEAKDAELLPRVFKLWENERQSALNKQMEDLLREQKMKNIDDKKKELQEKSRFLYFFENFSKHEMDFVEAEKRIAEFKSRTVVDEDYIPPEIR